MVCRQKLECNNNIIAKQSAMHTLYNTGEREKEKMVGGGGGGRKSIVGKRLLFNAI